jgi:hypothetical protein
MRQLQRLELMNVMLSVSFDCPIFDSRVTDVSITRVRTSLYTPLFSPSRVAQLVPLEVAQAHLPAS